MLPFALLLGEKTLNETNPVTIYLFVLMDPDSHLCDSESKPLNKIPFFSLVAVDVIKDIFPQDAFSLLAYSDPWSSPVGNQLDPIQREPVCSVLNSAILGKCGLLAAQEGRGASPSSHTGGPPAPL